MLCQPKRSSRSTAHAVSPTRFRVSSRDAKTIKAVRPKFMLRVIRAEVEHLGDNVYLFTNDSP